MAEKKMTFGEGVVTILNDHFSHDECPECNLCAMSVYQVRDDILTLIEKEAEEFKKNSPEHLKSWDVDRFIAYLK